MLSHDLFEAVRMASNVGAQMLCKKQVATTQAVALKLCLLLGFVHAVAWNVIISELVCPKKTDKCVVCLQFTVKKRVQPW